MARRGSPAPSRFGVLTWMLLAAVLVLGYMVAVQTFRPPEPPGSGYEAIKPASVSLPSKTAKPDPQPKTRSDAALADQVHRLERELDQKRLDLKAKDEELKIQAREIEELRMRLLIYESREEAASKPTP